MMLGQRYQAALDHLAQACREAGRDCRDVTLVAVSKTVGIEEVAQAIDAGALDFGENRPDELMRKHDRFPEVRWHFIGNIQSRRIRDIVGRAFLIHSLFEERHARKIDEVAREKGIVQDVLLEVNVSGEQSKSGLAPDQVESLLEVCGTLPNIRVCGLMTMAPRGDDAAARRAFSGLARLRDDLGDAEVCELSMGMSEDWPLAVEEGATIVRIGRAIFSEGF